MKPTFLIIGAQKAGTSSLYDGLKTHSEVYMSSNKEINFFFLDKEYAKGYKYYESNFKEAKKGQQIGEASPGYCCSFESIDRIKKYRSDIKLILLLRNPISRAYSQYWHNRRNLREPLTFSQVINNENLVDKYERGKKGYFSRGVYINQIKYLHQQFPKENLLILFFEDLVNNPSLLYNMCTNFLGINSFSKIPHVKKNQSLLYSNIVYQYLYKNPQLSSKISKHLKARTLFGKKKPYKYPKINPADKNKLIDFFTPSIEELEAYLDVDLSRWKN